MPKRSKKVIENGEILPEEIEETTEAIIDEPVEKKVIPVEIKPKVIKKGVNVNNPPECIEANCPSTFGKYGCRPCVIWRAFETQNKTNRRP